MAICRFAAGPLAVALVWAGAAVWSSGSSAEIYKWVDEKGVTNYSGAPPAHGKAQSLDLQSASVSVYPAPPPEQVARALDAAMRARIERLENELLSERRARVAQQTSTQVESDHRRLAYEQCLRDRRVDCDLVRDGLYAANYYSRYYAVAAPFVVAGRSFLAPRLMPVRPQPIFGTVAPFPASSPRVAGHRGSRELSRQGR